MDAYWSLESTEEISHCTNCLRRDRMSTESGEICHDECLPGRISCILDLITKLGGRP